VKKIPTIFERSADRRSVIDVVVPGCEWVLAGEGVATRKYDGTCVGIFGGVVFVRREVKAGSEEPANFIEADRDEATGKTVGWEPYGQSGFAKFVAEAIGVAVPLDGTYELCGPKINRNPENFPAHVLIPHANAQRLPDAPRDYIGLRGWLTHHHYEGIVWHHPDGRMAKLKARDFPLEAQ
jgi:hypothetical protein